MGIKVKALKPGYYGMKRRRIGDVFEIKDEKDRGLWMGRVSDDTPPAQEKIPFTSVVEGTASGGNVFAPPKHSQPWEEPVGESKHDKDQATKKGTPSRRSAKKSNKK
ncbi:MAG: hypothetical protein HN738_06385 [Gammaproteobacteria bacterium]|jgi:hypothetical protein|nr:hypothetical protein [Gammaproteobacteria bacterium]